jgi:hypothetical protein
MLGLLAYLIALVMLVGGGYAGLVWLANPPSTSSSVKVASSQAQMRGQEQTGSPTRRRSDHHPDAKRHGTGKDRTAGNDAASEVAAGNHDSTAAATEAPKTNGTQTQVATSDAVPARGCAPIGLTAQGDLVFPLQCRELLEQQRRPVRDLQPARAEPAQASPSEQAAPAAHQTAVPGDHGEGSAGPKLTEPPDNSGARPPSSSTNKLADEGPQRLKTKTDEPQKIRQPLRTSQFPRGHREAQTNRARKMASQSDETWFSPLTFH